MRSSRFTLTALVLGIGFVLSAQGCSSFSPFSLSQPADAGVFKSINGGDHWEHVVQVGESSLLARLNILTLTVDPIRIETVYAGTADSGMFKTEDGGRQWTRLSIPAVRVNTIVINPKQTEEVYAAGSSGGLGRIYKSSDAGETWEEVYNDPTPNASISAFDIDPDSPHILYAGTGANGIIKSTDGGRTWFLLRWSEAQVRILRVDMHNSRRLFVGTTDKGLYRSENSGSTFEHLPADQEFPGSSAITTLALDRSRAGVVYAGSSYGLLRSTDFGVNWDALPILIPTAGLPVRLVVVDPRQSSTVYVSTASTLYKSEDAGQTWSVKQLPSSRAITSFAINPENTQYLYLGLQVVQ
jgi:photosystem II stability/assembly factor-like uncharacterized protein